MIQPKYGLKYFGSKKSKEDIEHFNQLSIKKNEIQLQLKDDQQILTNHIESLKTKKLFVLYNSILGPVPSDPEDIIKLRIKGMETVLQDLEVELQSVQTQLNPIIQVFYKAIKNNEKNKLKRAEDKLKTKEKDLAKETIELENISKKELNQEAKTEIKKKFENKRNI